MTTGNFAEYQESVKSFVELSAARR
jgi:hypothetical protein